MDPLRNNLLKILNGYRELNTMSLFNVQMCWWNGYIQFKISGLNFVAKIWLQYVQMFQNPSIRLTTTLVWLWLDSGLAWQELCKVVQTVITCILLFLPTTLTHSPRHLIMQALLFLSNQLYSTLNWTRCSKFVHFYVTRDFKYSNCIVFIREFITELKCCRKLSQIRWTVPQ